MNIKYLFWLFLTLFVCSITLENTRFLKTYFKEKSYTILEQKLDVIKKQQKTIIEDENIDVLIETFDPHLQIYKSLKNKNFSIYAFKNNCLVYWSDNEFLKYEFAVDSNFESKIVTNNNGWFQMVGKKQGDYIIYCLFNFYRFYPKQSDYFESGFNEKLGLNKIRLKDNSWISDNRVGLYHEKHFLPELNEDDYFKHRSSSLFLWIYLGVFLILVGFLYKTANKKNGFDLLLFLNLKLTFISIFILLFLFNVILKDLKNLEVFSPNIAAYNKWIPSFGHGFLITILALSLSIIIYLNVKKNNFNAKVNKVICLPVMVFKFTFICIIIFDIIPVFINNSHVNYNLKELSKLDVWSFLGVFNVFLIFIACLFLSRVARLFKYFRSIKRNLIIEFFVALVIILIYNLIRHQNYFLMFCVLAFAVSTSYINLKYSNLKLSILFLIVSLISAIVAVQFEQVNSFKERETRKLFANKINSKQDLDLELKLLQIEKEIISANVLKDFYSYQNPDFQELELNNKYTFFNSIINDYEVDFLRFNENGEDITVNNFKFEYLKNLYNTSERSKTCNYFNYIVDVNFSDAYILKYDVCPLERTIGYVFLVLTPKLKSESYNLEYFFSSNAADELNIEDYSFCIYNSNHLAKARGTYPYAINVDFNYGYKGDESFVDYNGYSHYYKQINENSFVLVSQKNISFNKLLTVFTFLLLFFNAIVLAVFLILYAILFFIKKLNDKGYGGNFYIIMAKFFRLINIRKIYLETKIRFYFMLMALSIFAIVLFVVVQTVNNNFKEKQMELLDKKAIQISNEIELYYQKNELQSLRNLIKDLANRFELDINIYNADGSLLQTANNRIYYEGWFSNFINPKAYEELVLKKHYQFKQKESISKLSYLASYNAIFDQKRNLVGFVNIPYFSRDIDIKNQFSNFLSSLLNITSLLLILSLIIAVKIGSGLTKPLKLLMDSLAKIKLGKYNRKIALKRNDEIGQLVQQYNFMLEKLELSTKKLAETERDVAWREMAKQVAHEIKNPLTPMKLHLQHLQMSINREDENLSEKVSKTASVLIEQIDQLSKMADEFSSFAQMPAINLNIINVDDLLSDIIYLFKSHNELLISYNNNSFKACVLADSEQLQRVFNNIIKNAFQAKKDGLDCLLIINLEQIGNNIQISFKDNGKGIDESLMLKIFEPNFSTKNSGMGLGLSISKKIIEEFHGSVSFVSETNVGTTFFVILPIAE